MRDGVLTPRRGYVVTLAQLIGGRPRLAVSCSGCHFLRSSPVDDLEANDDATLGAVLRAALQTWQDHMCEDTYPSEANRNAPAGAGHP